MAIHGARFPKHVFKNHATKNWLSCKQLQNGNNTNSQSLIGWIFKPKANESYCLYNSGPIVRHYALNYGFRTFPNLLKNLLEREAYGFVCIQMLYLWPLGGSQRDTPRSRSLSFCRTIKGLDLGVSLWDPREVKGKAFVYKATCLSLRRFSTDSETYGSHS